MEVRLKTIYLTLCLQPPFGFLLKLVDRLDSLEVADKGNAIC